MLSPAADNMGNVPPPSQEGATLTKPADWALHMVAAALKFSSSNGDAVSTYSGPDVARLAILDLLNWYEAHDDYEWPDFTKFGFDFIQAMRFRRALVNDVFTALQKAGTVRVTGEAGTPLSGVGNGKRVSVDGGRRMAKRKHFCKRAVSSDTSVASVEDPAFYEQDSFLANSMRSLITELDRPIARAGSGIAKDDEAGEEIFAEKVRILVVEEWKASEF